MGHASLGSRVFDVANYVFLALLGIATLGPLLYLVFGSLTQAEYYRTVGVSINPAYWTLDSYVLLLGSGSRIYVGLKNSLFLAVVGTTLSLATASGRLARGTQPVDPGAGPGDCL